MRIFQHRIYYLVFIFFIIQPLFAAQNIHLTVAYKTVYFGGKPRKAMAINNQIPGPTLHFQQGETVSIDVHNQLDQETAIHWHGLLVPWQMDGVLGVTQHGIQPGQTFHYQFTLHQSGTYWYHSHAGLQEQQGLYGAIIIDPPKPPPYRYNQDQVIVLSEWSNTYPDQIYANLKKEGDYYSPRFPLQPSLARFLHDYRQANQKERQLLLSDYKMMQTMRMGIYDFSDVAYDAFLLNGYTNAHPWRINVKVGDVVRLRFIGAGASTIFHVKIPETIMQMVHVDGNDVIPYPVNDFTIAPGETYDVLVRIQQNKPYVIYAEALNTQGAAIGALVTSSKQTIDIKTIKPFKTPKPTSREMMENMMRTPQSDGDMSSESHHTGHHMNMMHQAPSENNQQAKTTPGTPYQSMTAAVPTNDPHKPIAKIINMKLSGFMDRYIWFINGIPEYKAKPIIFEPNKRYRLVFMNDSMMHHPMHIHGHWFILRKGLGQYDPLLHTIDVPPGATIVVDIDADASGQWFFHCHLLYHMLGGMSRVVQYSTLLEVVKKEIKPEDIVKNTAYVNRPIVRIDEVRPIAKKMVEHPMGHPRGFYHATALEVSADPFHHVQNISYKGLYGPDYNKLELLTKEAEIEKGSVENADIDIFYWHLLSQFWAIKGGINYFYRPAVVPYWQPGIGLEGLFPYFIETDLRAYYYGGSAKLDAEIARDTQLTNNVFLRLEVRGILASKTVTRAQLGSGLNQMRYAIKPYYRLMPGLNVYAEYEYQRNHGAFKNLQLNQDESASENTISFGLSLLF